MCAVLKYYFIFTKIILQINMHFKFICPGTTEIYEALALTVTKFNMFKT